jgi:hypothetical protein
MSKQVLMETVSEIKPVVDKKNNSVCFEGIFGLAGKKNLNGRLYPLVVMEKAVKDYNSNFIDKHRALGELDHPEDASVNLRNAAFIVEQPLKINEKGEVIGKARILENTPMGKIAADLMREGVVIGLSSRGLGEIAEKEIVNEESGEKEMVNEVSDFSIASFDLVSEPSIGMFVQPSKQVEAVHKPEEKKIAEKVEPSLNAGDLVSLSEILFEE